MGGKMRGPICNIRLAQETQISAAHGRRFCMRGKHSLRRMQIDLVVTKLKRPPGRSITGGKRLGTHAQNVLIKRNGGIHISHGQHEMI